MSDTEYIIEIEVVSDDTGDDSDDGDENTQATRKPVYGVTD